VYAHPNKEGVGHDGRDDNVEQNDDSGDDEWHPCRMTKRQEDRVRRKE
jgi:hypothetical protein